MLWSILICAIPERFHSVQPLLHSLLEKQSVARMPDVELLFYMDNKRRPVGAKRNDLLAMARGEYVSFVDDDDEVAPEYVEKIYNAIVKARKMNAKDVSDPTNSGSVDVICFPQRAVIKPYNVTHECTYSLAHWRDRKPDARRVLAQAVDGEDKPIPNTLNWTGPPAHTMIWRREVVKDIRFDEKNFGEDTGWVDAACEKAKNEMRIEGYTLYYYQFDEEKSATR